MVLFNVESKVKRDAYFKGILHERRVDGHLIIALDASEQEGQAFYKAKKPIVLVDTSHPLLPSIDIDNVAGGRLAAEYLLAKGYRRFQRRGRSARSARFGASGVSRPAILRRTGRPWRLDGALVRCRYGRTGIRGLGPHSTNSVCSTSHDDQADHSTHQPDKQCAWVGAGL